MAGIVIYARKSTESEDRQILSIDSQIRELKQFALREHLAVTQVFTESKSAKAPGRPVFNELYKRIQKGEFSGIVCWKLDRLARNPVDGGALIWAMEEQKLKSIHTPQRSFNNSGNDKFWMQLEFGMAKKYVDDLSDNVKRGLRAKIQLGWMPGMPPLGYLNNRNNRTVIPDHKRFRIIRRMWDLMLTGNYSPKQILETANKKWGLRTRQFSRYGGNPVSTSAVYTLFRNPFYYGAIVHHGETFSGKHKAMVSKSEFDKVQRLLDPAANRRPQLYSFAYTGMIKCGECGASITAEHKTNRYGQRYVYYHCSKRLRGPRCSQKAVEIEDLERQIGVFLDSLTISTKARDWALTRLTELQGEEKQKEQDILASLNRRYAACCRELQELVNLRIRGLLTDSEFLATKRELEDQRASLKELIEGNGSQFSKAVKRSIELFDFAQSARDVFSNGSIDAKRAVLRFTGSNLLLEDKTLLIQAQKPLRSIQLVLKDASARNCRFEPHVCGLSQHKYCAIRQPISIWCGLVEEVRTFFMTHQPDSSSQSINEYLKNPPSLHSA